MPLCLALALTFVGLLAASGGAGIFHGSSPSFRVYPWNRYFYLCLFAVFLIVGFANELRITLKWGKEAEDFEEELKEADEMEKERRR
jgi:hypothetical protein